MTLKKLREICQTLCLQGLQDSEVVCIGNFYLTGEYKIIKRSKGQTTIDLEGSVNW